MFKYFEHPIKYTGVSMNRIMYSNTRVAMNAFPDASEQKFNLSFKYRTFVNGKADSTRCKLTIIPMECLHVPQL